MIGLGKFFKKYVGSLMSYGSVKILSLWCSSADKTGSVLTLLGDKKVYMQQRDSNKLCLKLCRRLEKC